MNNVDRTFKPFVLISASTLNATKASNNAAHELLRKDLKESRLGFKEVIGVYKGVEEKSFYVEIPDKKEHYFDVLVDKAQEFKQESILYVDKSRVGGVFYVDTHGTSILGSFKQVSEQEAKQQDNYTYDYNNNGYYVCK